MATVADGHTVETARPQPGSGSPIHPGISPPYKESAISIVTILIVVILVLLAIYLAKRVL